MYNERIPNMKKLLIITLILLLVGCDRNSLHSQADELVLCNPTTKGAFYIRPGVGDTSFVKRNPSMDIMCNEQKTKN